MSDRTRREWMRRCAVCGIAASAGCMRTLLTEQDETDDPVHPVTFAFENQEGETVSSGFSVTLEAEERHRFTDADVTIEDGEALYRAEFRPGAYRLAVDSGRYLDAETEVTIDGESRITVTLTRGGTWPTFGYDARNSRYNPDGVGLSDAPAERWRFETDDSYFSSSPAVVDGTVYFGNGDDMGRDYHVYAVDAGTGDERWRYDSGHNVLSSPTVVDGTVYVGVGGEFDRGIVDAIDAEAGTRRWRFETDGTGLLVSPAVDDDTVYAATLDGTYYAIAAETGEERWRYETGRVVARSPAVVDGTVYAGCSVEFDGPDATGRVHALDAETGENRWTFETGEPVGGEGGMSSPAVVDGTVFVGSPDGHLYAIAAETGDERWRFETGGEVFSSPAVVDGTAYVGSGDGHLYAIATGSGEEHWRFETDGRVMSSPAVVDGTVYVGSQDDHLYAIAAETGEQRWRFETDGEVLSSPAAAGGIVYVGGETSVYALSTPAVSLE